MKIMSIVSVSPVAPSREPASRSNPVSAEPTDRAPRPAVDETAVAVSESDVRRLAAELNQRMEREDRALRFVVEEDEVVVSVIDRKSGEVVRQIPAEELVRMRERLRETRGVLLEERG